MARGRWPGGVVLATSLAVLAGCGSAASPGSDAGRSGSATSQHQTPSSGHPTSTAPAGKPVAVGQPVEISNHSGLRGSVTLAGVKTAAKPASEYADPPQHGAFVILDLKVAVQSGKYRVDSTNFRLWQPDGHVYDVTSDPVNTTMAGFTPDLPDTVVAQGQTIRGNVVIDAPKPPAGSILQILTDITEGTVVGEWSL